MGVQRKEFNDFVSSLFNGRMGEELRKLQQVDIRVLLVEGRPVWSSEGYAIHDYARITRPQYRRFILSCQQEGIVYLHTDDIPDTIAALHDLEAWLSKEHTSFLHRPNPKARWGQRDNRDWGIHLLQSFPMMGPKLAAAVYDACDGVPLRWTVSAEWLRKIPGVGKARASRWIAGLEDVVRLGIDNPRQKREESGQDGRSQGDTDGTEVDAGFS